MLTLSLVLFSLAAQAQTPFTPGIYQHSADVALESPYRIELMDLRTPSGRSRFQEVRSSGAVCEVIQSAGRCRIAGGQPGAAQVARAKTLALDFLSKVFPGGRMFLIEQKHTAIREVAAGPQLMQFEVDQRGLLAGKRFDQYQIYKIASGGEKVQLVETFWLERKNNQWIYRFPVQVREGLVTWIFVASTKTLNR